MCGSSPLPEAVTKSTGRGRGLSGSAVLSASMRACMAFINASLVGPRLDPAEAAALKGKGDVGEGRPQKYFGASNGWPINDDPTGLPSIRIRLPLACRGNSI